MCKQLVAFLCGRIQTYRIIHSVIRTKGHLLVAAIDRRRTGIDKMLHGIVTASLQDVIEPYDVRLDIGVRIGDGITHPGLGSQVHHHCRAVFLKNAVDGRLVGDVTLDELIIDN